MFSSDVEPVCILVIAVGYYVAKQPKIWEYKYILMLFRTSVIYAKHTGKP